MTDTVYLYDAYSPDYDEHYIIKSDTALTPGTWVRDHSEFIRIQQPYRPTSKLQSTIILQLGLLVGILFALFGLIIYLIYRQRKTDSLLKRR